MLINQNLILLIFKFHFTYIKVKSLWQIGFNSAFFHKLVKIKNLEKGTTLRNRRKFDVIRKWLFVENALQSE